MKKRRLIPVLLLRNGWLVQSKNFKEYQNLGNPVTAVKRLSEWASDELIYLDISQDNIYDINRSDQGYPNRKFFLDIISDVSKVTFMPITVGGKISNIKDIENRLKVGADKISLNTKAIYDLNFVKKASKEFGSQCIVISIDFIKEDNEYFIYDNKKRSIIKLDIFDYINKIQDNGAGEILLNSVNRDGTGKGYDIDFYNKIYETINIPIIACGGAGDWFDMFDVFDKTKVDAVAAANIFHYRDQSVFLAKKFLYEKNINVRKPDLLNIK